jgi:hypothetical protein
LQTSQRTFARKVAKGAYGKESTLGNNFEFPKHKELLQGDYYNEEKEVEMEDLISSPLNDRLNQ